MPYILKKVISFIITLFIVSVVAFFAFQIVPGDPATQLLGTEATPERLEALRAEMGLNDPVYVQYANWLSDFVHGDMGTSYTYNVSVSSLIAEKLPITLSMAVFATLMMVLISFPLGIFAARHAGKIIDHILQIVNQIMMAVPPFFLGILFTYLFGLLLKWFVPGAFVSYHDSIGGFIQYLFFPALAIALPKAAMIFRLLRSSMIEETGKDYVRTTFSRGNTVNGVMYGHVLRNAMIPVITFIALAFGDMVAGSIIVEQVFGIPGISKILIASISNRDYPVVQAIILMTACVMLLANLLADLVYRVIDPRIGA
jgi:ABC-type dipeptide/oligopeptide/nickel transport system permease component